MIGTNDQFEAIRFIVTQVANYLKVLQRPNYKNDSQTIRISVIKFPSQGFPFLLASFFLLQHVSSSILSLCYPIILLELNQNSYRIKEHECKILCVFSPLENFLILCLLNNIFSQNSMHIRVTSSHTTPRLLLEPCETLRYTT